MKIDKATIQRWAGLAANWLSVTHPHIKCVDVKTGKDAWTIAHRSGVTNDAYKDRNVTDAHIQTALESIFPNAVFKDKKRY